MRKITRTQLRRILIEELQWSRSTRLIKEELSEDEISAIKGEIQKHLSQHTIGEDEISAIKGEIQKQLEPLKQAILDIAEVSGVKIQGDLFS